MISITLSIPTSVEGVHNVGVLFATPSNPPNPTYSVLKARTSPCGIRVCWYPHWLILPSAGNEGALPAAAEKGSEPQLDWSHRLHPSYVQTDSETVISSYGQHVWIHLLRCFLYLRKGSIPAILRWYHIQLLIFCEEGLTQFGFLFGTQIKIRNEFGPERIRTSTMKLPNNVYPKSLGLCMLSFEMPFAPDDSWMHSWYRLKNMLFYWNTPFIKYTWWNPGHKTRIKRTT